MARPIPYDRQTHLGDLVAAPHPWALCFLFLQGSVAIPDPHVCLSVWLLLSARWVCHPWWPIPSVAECVPWVDGLQLVSLSMDPWAGAGLGRQ